MREDEKNASHTTNNNNQAHHCKRSLALPSHWHFANVRSVYGNNNDNGTHNTQPKRYMKSRSARQKSWHKRRWMVIFIDFDAELNGQ